MSEEEPTTAFEFPCQFPIKAIGKSGIEFELLVIDIIRQHVESLPKKSVKTRESKNGKFVSVTATIEAQSKAQLDAIYQQLNDHSLVLTVL